MTNLEIRLSGDTSGLSEVEKNAIVRMAKLIAIERGEPVITPNLEKEHV